MIVCKNIFKIYKSGESESLALNDISFSVKKGEFIAIMGPSGSGKSTLMSILGLLDSPTQGKYILDSRDVSKMTEDEAASFRMQKIGFVFQSFNLLPRASVIRNVTLPLIYKKIPFKKREKLAQNVLRAVDFPENRWNNLSNHLSGGQMQRVAIARALVNNPSLILADEPTGNLDSKTGEAVMKLFQKLNKEQKHTVILITHELEIAYWADRIITIRDGSLVSDERNK